MFVKSRFSSDGARSLEVSRENMSLSTKLKDEVGRRQISAQHWESTGVTPPLLLVLGGRKGRTGFSK